MWIVWVHTFNLNGRKPWEVKANQASWIVRKIIQVGHWSEDKGLQIAKSMETDDFSIKKMYKKIRGDYTRFLGGE